MVAFQLKVFERGFVPGDQIALHIIFIECGGSGNIVEIPVGGDPLAAFDLQHVIQFEVAVKNGNSPPARNAQEGHYADY